MLSGGLQSDGCHMASMLSSQVVEADCLAASGGGCIGAFTLNGKLYAPNVVSLRNITSALPSTPYSRRASKAVDMLDVALTGTLFADPFLRRFRPRSSISSKKSSNSLSSDSNNDGN